MKASFFSYEKSFAIQHVVFLQPGKKRQIIDISVAHDPNRKSGKTSNFKVLNIKCIALFLIPTDLIFPGEFNDGIQARCAYF